MKSSSPASCACRAASCAVEQQVAHAEVQCRKLGPLWKLICSVLKRTLSYDVCVVKSAAFLQYPRRLDSA
eukprot:6543808-Pyramimonas_sp.AAC.1